MMRASRARPSESTHIYSRWAFQVFECSHALVLQLRMAFADVFTRSELEKQNSFDRVPC